MTLLLRSFCAARNRTAGATLFLVLGALCLLLPGLAPPASAASSSAAVGIRVVDVAARFAGVPYLYGGTTPRGFDCSGFTRYVYARLGKSIPRVAQAQYDRARKIGRNVRVGDLVFFYRSTVRHVYHVGIYAGAGRVWHAPHSGARVRLERIWTSSWTGGRYGPA